MSWLSNLIHGGKNPADSAMPYLNQIPGQTNQYFEPYFNKGKEALGRTFDEYGNLIENPGGKLNEIGMNFHESPGFQFALQQALQGSGHAAAAGGMAGSPQHEQENMQLATNLGNQEYNNWLTKALGLYGTGLEGEQTIAGMGQNAGNNIADMNAQTLAQKANLAFQGQRQKNQNQSDFFGNLIKGAGALTAFTPFRNISDLIRGGMSSNMYGGG